MKKRMVDAYGCGFRLRTHNESIYLLSEPERLLQIAYIDLDRTKARELAAILTHFADTGELPGEACDAD